MVGFMIMYHSVYKYNISCENDANEFKAFISKVPCYKTVSWTTCNIYRYTMHQMNIYHVLVALINMHIPHSHIIH
jgi:hypothetical protein